MFPLSLKRGYSKENRIVAVIKPSGTGQADAAELTADINILQGPSNSLAVRLPKITRLFQQVTVILDPNYILTTPVFPAVGSKIWPLGSNASSLLRSQANQGALIMFTAINFNEWIMHKTFSQTANQENAITGSTKFDSSIDVVIASELRANTPSGGTGGNFISSPASLAESFWLGTAASRFLVLDSRAGVERLISGADAVSNVTTPTDMPVSAGDNVTGGNNNVNGGTLLLRAGKSKGTGTSLVDLHASPVGASGNTLNTPQSVLALRTTGATFGAAVKAIFDSTDTTGTPGAATVNKPSGQAKIANGAASVVITNSLVTTASIVYAVVQEATDDATLLYVRKVVPAAGSFEIFGNATATTKDVQVGWTVFN